MSNAVPQALEMGLWMWSFAYYVYPAVLLGIMLSGTIFSGSAVYKQRKRLTAAFSQYRLVPIVRRGYVRAASAVQLIPGDVVVVLQGMAACDMVLLRGNCLVEEAALTGEVGGHQAGLQTTSMLGDFCTTKCAVC